MTTNPAAEPGKPITNANRITMAEIEALQAANRAVVIYPRKGVVIVDGFKRYQLDGTPAMTKRQLKEANRGKKEKAEGRDVRATADVRKIVSGSEPDRLADRIAVQFSGSRLDAIRAFYKHRPRGDAWFLVEALDDAHTALKSLRALIHDLGVQDADDSWYEAIARTDAVIARIDA
jgi:hypothetical protein